MKRSVDIYGANTSLRPNKMLRHLSWMLLFAFANVWAKPYAVLTMDPSYQIEAMDPEHHWAPSLNEALKEYSQKNKNINPEFFNWVSSEKPDLPRVKYLTPLEVQAYKQKILPSKIIVNDLTGEKHGKGMEMFVMTSLGDFYVNPKRKATKETIGFNHSSFFQGGPISGVGFFHFDENGGLIGVDNFSGHYKPNPSYMINVLQELQSKGIDLANVTYYHRVSPESEKKETYNAKKWYLANKSKIEEPKKTELIISGLFYRLQQADVKGALVIGGGIAYDSINYLKNQANDIDGMFIFTNRAALEAFLKSNSKEKVQKLLGYDQSFVYFTKDEIDAFINKKIQVMRVAGNIDNLKVTVKLTDYETLMQSNIGQPFQVLSKLKDVRTYPRRSLMGDNVEVMLVNKTLTQPPEPAYIILDRNYYSYEDTLAPGLITDFLITAKAIGDYQARFHTLQAEKRLQMLQLTAEKGCLNPHENISQYLVREKRFSKKYREKINNYFNEALRINNIKLKKCTRKPNENGFLVDINPEIFANPSIVFDYKTPKEITPAPFPANMKELVINAVKKLTSASNVKIEEEGEKFYSSNKYIGKILVDNKATYFYKGMREKDPTSILAEINSLENLQQLYTHILKPIYVDAGYRFLIQDYFDGKELTELYKGSLDDNAALVFKVELERAEELLTGYLASLEQAKRHAGTPEKIQKLYYERLVGERIKDYYLDKTIKLPDGQTIAFEQFKKLRPIINGKQYKTLEDVIVEATANLKPENLATKVKVYGFGDNHGGNVMVKSDGKYVTIDYEYAGFAHPCEDLAKTIYNDVYFDILFPAHASQNNFKIDTHVDLKRNIITINHNYQLSRNKQALLATKVKGVLEPFFKLAKEKNHNTSNWQQILKSSLFAAGFLNKNIFKYPTKDAFLAYAILIQIAGEDNSVERTENKERERATVQ